MSQDINTTATPSPSFEADVSLSDTAKQREAFLRQIDAFANNIRGKVDTISLTVNVHAYIPNRADTGKKAGQRKKEV